MGANLKPTCIVIDQGSVYLLDVEKSQYLVKEEGFREIPKENYKYLPKAVQGHNRKIMAVDLPPSILQAIRDEDDDHEAPGVIYIMNGEAGFEEMPEPPEPKHPSGLNADDYKNSSDIARQIVHFMLTQVNPVSQLEAFKHYRPQYDLFTKEGEINLITLAGSTIDFKHKEDTRNEFDDVRLILRFKNGKDPYIDWKAITTCDAGPKYTYSPMNKLGAAAVSYGQIQAHVVGFHNYRKNHPCLVNSMKTPIYRDKNKDFERGNDALWVGIPYCNWHHGWNTGVRNISNTSAGCNVTPKIQDQLNFMNKVYASAQYKKNKAHPFCTTTIPLKWVKEGITEEQSEWM